MPEKIMNTISFQSVYQTITSRGEFKLGQMASTPDGRKWQFIKATTAIATGLVAVPTTVTSADLWSSASDNQGRKVYLTRAASSMTIGAFEDGIGVVDDGTGIGQTFKIKTNNATTLTLYPESALSTSLAVADSDLTFINMSQCDPAAITSKVQMAQGAAQVSFSASDYGWILVNGDGRCIPGNTLVVGAGFSTGDDTVGQVIVAVTATGAYDFQNLGYDIVANASADTGALVRFNIR